MSKGWWFTSCIREPNNHVKRQWSWKTTTLNTKICTIQSKRGPRWISASNLMLWHHFHSTCKPEFPTGANFPGAMAYGCIHCPWDSIPMVQTLCAYQIWMYDMVWGGYQAQPWHNDIIPTPQLWPRIPKSGANLASVTVWMHRYALETAYQWLQCFVYV